MKLIYLECFEPNHISPDCVLSLEDQVKFLTNYERVTPTEKIEVPSALCQLIRRELGMDQPQEGQSSITPKDVAEGPRQSPTAARVTVSNSRKHESAHRRIPYLMYPPTVMIALLHNIRSVPSSSRDSMLPSSSLLQCRGRCAAIKSPKTRTNSSSCLIGTRHMRTQDLTPNSLGD